MGQMTKKPSVTPSARIVSAQMTAFEMSFEKLMELCNFGQSDRDYSGFEGIIKCQGHFYFRSNSQKVVTLVTYLDGIIKMWILPESQLMILDRNNQTLDLGTENPTLQGALAKMKLISNYIV
ncbi:MAG: hypothetical protein NTZ49_00680 [Candidatus Parcubacteria bacterium]|nr:hypothetical protein [Candidatus Parcubacteria bacterium]